MKRKIATVIIASLLISSCNSINNRKNGELLTTFYVASDIHLLSNNLIDSDNQTYKKSNLTSDGRIQECDYTLVETLIHKVNQNKPKFLILTGDLTFNGEYNSHTELVRLLHNVNDDTKVLVLPGNHDINNIYSRSFKNDTIKSVDNISYESFKNLYSDFGYGDALSVASDTLSYAYAIDDNTIGVFLDTTLSEYNAEFETNFVGGWLYEDTLAWLEGVLSKAKEDGKQVISFTHHNLFDHSSVFHDKYTIDNADELANLYNKYGVKLNFSGHLHIQNIAENNGIYDVASGSLLDTANLYGVVNIYKKAIEYDAYSVDESTAEYAFNIFKQKYHDKTLTKNKEQYGDDADKLSYLLGDINAYYFGGNYKMVNQIIKEHQEDIDRIKNNETTSKYVLSMLELEDKNQLHLRIER